MNPLMLHPPSGSLFARISVPGSKSVANRALVCAFLADGESELFNVPSGDDTQALIAALFPDNARALNGESNFWVTGRSSVHLPPVVNARLAGTTSRFLTAVAALGDEPTLIDGDAPLRSRPMMDLHSALASLGASVHSQDKPGFLPVVVQRGTLDKSSVSIAGDISSQFISALMLIGPCLPQGLSIKIEGPLVSRSYIEMTARVMASFGAEVKLAEKEISISATRYSPRKYVIEPDFSSAAFGISAVLIRGGEITITDLALSCLQGDAAILDIARMMGAEVLVAGDDVVVSRDARSPLSALSLDMSDCSDLVPATAVVCCHVSGKNVLSGVGFIRSKESDRLGDLARELNRMGASVVVTPDGLEIFGAPFVSGVVCQTYHDHRLAMALSLCALSVSGVGIDDSSVVSKSWPTYFEDMTRLLGPTGLQN